MLPPQMCAFTASGWRNLFLQINDVGALGNPSLSPRVLCLRAPNRFHRTAALTSDSYFPGSPLGKPQLPLVQSSSFLLTCSTRTSQSCILIFDGGIFSLFVLCEKCFCSSSIFYINLQIELMKSHEVSFWNFNFGELHLEFNWGRTDIFIIHQHCLRSSGFFRYLL